MDLFQCCVPDGGTDDVTDMPLTVDNFKEPPGFFGTDETEGACVTDPNMFATMLKAFAKGRTEGLLHVHFTSGACSTAEPKKWCPDCRDADAVLKEGTRDFDVLGVSLSRREWRVDPGPKHPYRDLFGISSIPTLAAFSVAEVDSWDGESALPPQLLVDDMGDCTDGARLSRALQPFFGSQGSGCFVQDSAASRREMPHMMKQFAKSGKGWVCVHFTAEVNNKTGVKWCPDCKVADPILAAGLQNERVMGVSISRQEWKVDPGDNHPFRSLFGLSGIPSLALFSQSEIEKWDGEEALTAARLLGDEECKDASKIASALNPFFGTYEDVPPFCNPFFQVSDTNTFVEEVKIFAKLSRQGLVYVHFTANVDERTGLKWCPDCIESDPILRAGTRNVRVLGVSLSRYEWKEDSEDTGKNHVYRTLFGLSGIPTLAAFTADELKEWDGKTALSPQMLGEEECKDPSKVAVALTPFFGNEGSVVRDASALPGTLKEFAKGGTGWVAVHFTANVDSEKNMKWCPDCRVGDPILAAGLTNVRVLGVSISRSEWKEESEGSGANHPYRKQFGVQGIPSLAFFPASDVESWDGKGTLEAACLLGDEGCKDKSKLEAALESEGAVCAVM
jgi:thiol-disulfide isomerase/thioredoxin